MWFVVALVTIVLSYLIIKTINFRNYWQKRGVPHLKPWPLFGNLEDVVLRKRNFTNVIQDYYKSFTNTRYFGIHQFDGPTLIIKDIELIKRITIKDFEHFVDHTRFADPDLEPLFGKNLFMLTGEKWKDMRGILSPSFTGNKIRVMFTLMLECAKQFNEHFLRQDKDVFEVEMKELMGKVTNDVVATCAFGVQCNSIEDKDNEFYKMARSVINSSAAMWVKAFIQMYLPALSKKLEISLFPKNVSRFFTNVIEETLRIREEKNIIRPDMIHILMEAKKGRQFADESKNADAGFAAVDDPLQNGQTPDSKKAELTVDDIVAQAFLFFLAGFESVSVLLSSCLYELAINMDVQKKLQAEIDETFEKSKGDLTYDTVVNMKYLDMVISEALRKWPSAILLSRLCVKDYIIEPDETYGEGSVLIEKGMGVVIPVHAIHMDPKYYPEPDKFEPERFSEENKHNIVPYSYLPFGLGPRNCIGSRFALLESKTIIAYILSKFDVIPTSKTEIPLKLSPKTTSPCPEGYFLALKKR